MSSLALGTVQFGLPYGIANKTGQVSSSVAKDMLRLAISQGIDTLDTAIAYGESEACLGQVGTAAFKLITKLPAIPSDELNVTDWVRDQITASFSRLKVNSVYGLLLHRPDQLLSTKGEQLIRAMRKLKKNGLVQKIGISIYAPSELNELVPRFQFDLVQAPLNLIDRRLATSGWLRRLKDLDIEVHTRSAFLQGLLLLPRSAIPLKFSPWKNIWDTWHDWLEHESVSAVQASLAFPLSFSEIDRVVIGADSQEQLSQIIGAARTFPIKNLPNISCEDENLINPAHWNKL